MVWWDGRCGVEWGRVGFGGMGWSRVLWGGKGVVE